MTPSMVILHHLHAETDPSVVASESTVLRRILRPFWKASLDLTGMSGLRHRGEWQQAIQNMSPLLWSNAFTSQEWRKVLSESGSGHGRTGAQAV